ncbi:MAG: VOC family protein [Acidobacteriaceae bacterium]|nr:VOC family protein [Acidobacteriaceae bacterium]MBV8569987.1 VOC family protein [Acidobacteriaceae bacterium]
MPDVNNPPASGLSPHIFVSNADSAIDFYKRAFGAHELGRHPAPDGKRIMHASLAVNGATLMLCDDFPEFRGGQRSTPEALGGSPVVLHLQVQDADSFFNRAVQAGATVVMPLQDQFWGDRYGQIKDPFGHTWSIGAKVRNVSEEELLAASREHFG